MAAGFVGTVLQFTDRGINGMIFIVLHFISRTAGNWIYIKIDLYNKDQKLKGFKVKRLLNL